MSYKLIRDKMKGIINQFDPNAIVKRISDVYPDDVDDKFREFLSDKLHEETLELMHELRKKDIDPEKVDEEAGDVLEVLYMISDLYGYNDLEHINQLKREVRGSFYDGWLLDTATGRMPVGE